MKKYILLILIIQFCFFTKAQETLYGIEQIAGSETLVKDWFSDKGASGDYTFSVLLPVGGCPRCEGSIPLFFIDTKKYYPENHTIIIALCHNPKTAQEKLSAKNYGTNNIVCIDYDDPLMKSLHFKTGSVGVPYIVIVNNKTGDFINASPLLGISYDLDFFNSLTENLNIVKVNKTSRKTTANRFSGKILPAKIKLKALDTKPYNINCPDLPTISNLAFSKDISKTAWLEYETSTILLAEKKADRFVFTDTIKISEPEYYMFKAHNVPDSIVLALKYLNALQVMYLDIAFLNNDEDLLISASLPCLYWEDSIAEKLSYTNEACFIQYNLKNKSKTIIPLQLDSLLITSHTRFFIDEENQRVFMRVLKGWPVQGTTDCPKSADTDPFDDEFYDFSPMLSVLQMPQFVFSQYLGNLPQWHKQEHTGYFFFSPKICCDRKHIVVADTYTGEITTFEKNSLKQVSTFNITDKLLRKGLLVRNDTTINYNSTKSKLQNIIDKKELLPCRILDIAYAQNTYYILLTDEDNVILYVCFPETDKILSTDYIESSLTSDKNNMKLFYDNGQLKISAIDNHSGKVKINIMTLTQ